MNAATAASPPSIEEVDAVVIGAGVVGLACARALAMAGREVLILESEGGIGTGVSSRNSEVIHAGIYYPTGSVRAALCVRGKHLLYDYCAARNVGHRRTTKMIVATAPSHVAKLEQIKAQAEANDVHDLQWLDAARARALEPAVNCVTALLSPSTGIVDSHGLMLALQGDAENHGAALALQSPVDRMALLADGRVQVDVASDPPMRLAARLVVNCAGLHAVELARRTEGFPAAHVPPAHFAKGNYFSLAGRAPFSRLVYPVPEPGGLGVHLTLDLGGQARFGPDVQWLAPEDGPPFDYQVDPRRGDHFYAEIRKYWPALADGALQPAYSGVRPKITGKGEVQADFRIEGPRVHGVPGIVQLFGIESPGLTSALAIGDVVAEMAAEAG